MTLKFIEEIEVVLIYVHATNLSSAIVSNCKLIFVTNVSSVTISSEDADERQLTTWGEKQLQHRWIHTIRFLCKICHQPSFVILIMRHGTKFTWIDSLNQLFEESKRVIVSKNEEGIRIFDPSKPTCLATDWAETGVGFWLFQKHCDCSGNKPFCCHDGWRITLVRSRFTHPVEARYTPVDGEALALDYGLSSTRFFVLGCENLTVAVNCRPLLKVFQDRALEDVDNSRLCNLKEKTLRYRFCILHISGVKQKAADATS